MKKYTRAYAEELAKKIVASPTPETAQELNKRGVVEHCMPAIEVLLGRGFTIPQVADSIRGGGFDITTPTLKSYMQRLKGKKGKGPRKTPPVTPPAVVPATTSAPSPHPNADRREAAGPPPKVTAEARPTQARSTNDEFLATDRKTL